MTGNGPPPMAAIGRPASRASPITQFTFPTSRTQYPDGAIDKSRLRTCQRVNGRPMTQAAKGAYPRRLPPHGGRVDA